MISLRILFILGLFCLGHVTFAEAQSKRRSIVDLDDDYRLRARLDQRIPQLRLSQLAPDQVKRVIEEIAKLPVVVKPESSWPTNDSLVFGGPLRNIKVRTLLELGLEESALEWQISNGKLLIGKVRSREERR